ncbi:MAG TPA: hypothetical protein VFY65_02055, partial [Longimicrobium sp.]|nr:hypothetical protein [Longimicrobium sp.]
MMQPRRVGVVGHSNYELLRETLARLQAFAGRAGVSLFFEPGLRALVDDGELLTPEVCAELDLVVTLGGDGTLLRGARLVASPGCFATTIELGLLPLARAGWLRGPVQTVGMTGS